MQGTDTANMLKPLMTHIVLPEGKGLNLYANTMEDSDLKITISRMI